MELGEKFNGMHITTVYAVNSSMLWWGWKEEDIRKLGLRLLEKLKNPEERKKHFELIDDVFEKAVKSADRIKAIDLTKPTDEELKQLFYEHFNGCKEAHSFMNVDVDAFDIAPAEIFNDMIGKDIPKDIDLEKSNAIFSALTTPILQSYVQRERLAILNLAKKIKQGEELENHEDLIELEKNFWWTSLGWENVKPKDIDYFEEEVKKAVNKDIDAEISKLEQQKEETIQKRKEFIEKYNISKETIDMAELFDSYTHYHDLRKEMQVRTMYSFYLLLCEVAKRKNLNPDDLEWMTFNEVASLLDSTEFDAEEVNKRKKAITITYEDNKIVIVSGDEAEKKRQKLIEWGQEEVDELKGMCSSPGKVKGVVKVCAGAKEAFEKVQKGDILVTGMTLPDYVPAMKKAAAIITDEGGITSHAAIVSRELGVPCVTGTHIATKALKDGDLVEVDADNGIVRKVK